MFGWCSTGNKSKQHLSIYHTRTIQSTKRNMNQSGQIVRWFHIGTTMGTSKNRKIRIYLPTFVVNWKTWWHNTKLVLKETFNVISDASFKTFFTSRCAPYPKSIEFALTWTSMTFELSCFLPTSLKHWGQCLLQVPQTCKCGKKCTVSIWMINWQYVNVYLWNVTPMGIQDNASSLKNWSRKIPTKLYFQFIPFKQGTSWNNQLKRS